MSGLDHGQVTATAAEVYESMFVPALFSQWTGNVLDAAHVRPGDRVLDVGCGTGVLTRAAIDRAGPHGSVTGLDPNEGMLSVARRLCSEVHWEHGIAERMPFEDGAFDCVVSQFALMFCTDQRQALREMARVVRPGGHAAIAIWASLDRNPGYAALTTLVERHFGSDAAEAIRGPFQLGSPATVEALLADVPAEAEIIEHAGTATFESLDAWLHTEIRGWTLAETVDDDDLHQLTQDARLELARFVDGGRVSLPVRALVICLPPPRSA